MRLAHEAGWTQGYKGADDGTRCPCGLLVNLCAFCGEDDGVPCRGANIRTRSENASTPGAIFAQPGSATQALWERSQANHFCERKEKDDTVRGTRDDANHQVIRPRFLKGRICPLNESKWALRR